MDTEYWYRVLDVRTTQGAALHTERYRVDRHTPKGVWLDLGYPPEKFVLKGARKRWACPTEGEAMESFLARKRRQRTLLRAQLDHVEQALALAGHGRDPSDPIWRK
jgi:hypothetical protein